MKRRIAVSAVGLLSLLLLGTWLSSHWAADAAFRAGRAAGTQTLQRLQLVWLNLEQVPEDDRRVLANLAMRCRLDQDAPVAENVVRCLRTATAGRDFAEERAVLARHLPSTYAIPTEGR